MTEELSPSRGMTNSVKYWIPQPVEECAALFEIDVRGAVADGGAADFRQAGGFLDVVLVRVGHAGTGVHDLLLYIQDRTSSVFDWRCPCHAS